MSVRTRALGPVLALALAGCGSSGAAHSGPRSNPSGTFKLPTATRPSAAGQVAGREVFGHACSTCHSLSGHSTPKQQGGDLLHDPLRRAVLVQFTSEMPVKHRLTRAELNAVVDYVLAVQKRGGSGS
jgi:mono/diheme cytochrome c family protein